VVEVVDVKAMVEGAGVVEVDSTKGMCVGIGVVEVVDVKAMVEDAGVAGVDSLGGV
jgi:hypothetical protein